MPSKYREYSQQWHHAGFYTSKVDAERRASELKPKFSQVKVAEGSHGKAWGKEKKGYRVLVK